MPRQWMRMSVGGGCFSKSFRDDDCVVSIVAVSKDLVLVDREGLGVL